MTLPVLQTPAQIRRGARSLGLSGDGTLLKQTPVLEVVRVWVDGQHRLDYDMPLQYRDAFLTEAFTKLVEWQVKQGLALAPWDKRLRPPDNTNSPAWHRFKGDQRFWWKGPLQALSFDQRLHRVGTGDENLEVAGGLIAYRVGSYFLVRQHIAEVIR